MSMADDIIDGMFDSISGEYLGDAVGYPRTIHGYKPKRKLYTSNGAKYRGMVKYMNSKNINNLIDCVNAFIEQSNKCSNDLLKKKWTFRNRCIYISSACFSDFAAFIGNNKNKWNNK